MRSRRVTTARPLAATSWPVERRWSTSDTLEQGGLDRVRVAGDRLAVGLRALATRHPVITDIRGAGLMRGLEMTEAAATRVVDVALTHRLLVNRTAGRVIRAAPAADCLGLGN